MSKFLAVETEVIAMSYLFKFLAVETEGARADKSKDYNSPLFKKQVRCE